VAAIDHGEVSMTGKSEILQVLDGLADAFNAHDIDRIMAYFTEDCSLDMPRGPEPHGKRYLGKEQVRQGLLTRFETIPDVHYGDFEHFHDGNTGMSKWLLTGTTQSGETLEVRGCDFYTFQNGKVVSKDSYWKIVDR
jgi:ketosteroid isomerase-like protein